MKKYERYQDYVIKDGKLVGEFDQMYRDHDDPWDQSTREQSALEKLIALELIRRNCYKRVIEFGSGLGYFTAELATVCSQVLGVDVSKTAITRARQRHPYLTFEKADLLDFDVIRRFHPDCLLMAEITWYVLPKLEAFKAFLRTEFGGGGAHVGFIHLLMTYRDDEQKYGHEFFTNIDQIMAWWDCITFKEWGTFSRPEYKGGKRTFCYGIIK